MFIDNNPIIWMCELTKSPTIPVILPIIHHNYPLTILIKPMIFHYFFAIFHYFFAINGTYFNDNQLMVPILVCVLEHLDYFSIYWEFYHPN